MRAWKAGGRNKAGGCWLLSPPSSHSLKEPSSGGPGHHHSLAFPPSRLQRDRHKHRAERAQEGSTSPQAEVGKGLFDWILLGEREISDEAAAGGLMNPILDAPPCRPKIHTSICQSWHDAGLGSAPLTWGLLGDGLEAQGAGGRKEPSHLPFSPSQEGQRHI